MKFAESGLDALKKSLRFLVQFSIIGYLLYQLYMIGLAEILRSLPTNPLFYLLYFVIYFSLPIAEVWIYKIKWPISFRNSLPVFIQKKVLNTDVLGYSGELYLYYWAKSNLQQSGKQILHFIKDNNILSSISSTVITVLLLFFFVTQGYINITDYIGDVTRTTWILIVIAVLVAFALIYRFRKSIILIPRKESLKIFSLHSFRIIFINALQIIQWKVGRPEIAYTVWFSFSAVQILSSRIPFLPSYDALFVNVALEMSHAVAVPKEAIVGVLTANLILKRIMNLLSYFISDYLKKKYPVEISENPEPEIRDNA